MRSGWARQVGLGVMLSVLCAALPATGAEDPRAREPEGWDVRLAAADEPGDPFELSGTVLDDKGAPLAGAKLFVYHADAAGRYVRGPDQPMRLAATLRTDERGRYRIRSVFPGLYGGVPAHVHFEFLDPALGASEVQLKRKGGEGPAAAVTVSRDRDGVWRLTRSLTPHGSRAPSTGSASAPRDTLRSPR